METISTGEPANLETSNINTNKGGFKWYITDIKKQDLL